MPLRGQEEQKPRQPSRERNQYISFGQSTTHSPRPDRSTINHTKYGNGMATKNTENDLLEADKYAQTRQGRRERFSKLKMDLPNSSIAPRAPVDRRSSVDQGGHSPDQNSTPNPQDSAPPASTFGDTTSIGDDLYDDDYEGDDLHEEDHQTVVLRAHPRLPSRSQPYEQKYARAQTNPLDEVYSQPEIDVQLGENWRDIVQEEKALQEEEQTFYIDTRGQGGLLQSAKSGLYPAMERHRPVFADTPSRSHTTSRSRPDVPLPRTKEVSFDTPATKKEVNVLAGSPELKLPRGKDKNNPFQSAAGVTQDQEDHDSKTLTVHKPQQHPLQVVEYARSGKVNLVEQHSNRMSIIPPHTSTFESSRASDYPTSSEEENPPVHSRPPSPAPDLTGAKNILKRQREDDLDYDLDTLKTMKFKDLCQQKFELDPRSMNQSPGFDARRDTSTSFAQLENLDKITEDNQKFMFRGQTDEEWVQTGSWFISKFQEDLKRLLDVKFERRKISMKFEDEVRRRHRDVEWSVAGVDEELQDLRKGGGELIKGRDSASRKGTPQK